MELARWDEQQLVQRCKDGSEAAFAELVRRYRPRLFTLAYRLTSDRKSAEDVVQETFVAAFRAIDRFEPKPSLSAWLNTILIRIAARAAAKAELRPRGSLDAMLSTESGVDGMAMVAGAVPHEDPHAAAETAELRLELTRAIASLPFKYRAAVVTRYVLGLDYGEAASALDLGLNTYKSHLLRGTRILRNLLVDSVPAPAPDTEPVARRGQVAAGALLVSGTVPLPRSEPQRRPLERAVRADRRGAAEAAAAAPARAAAAPSYADTRSVRFVDRRPGEGPARS